LPVTLTVKKALPYTEADFTRTTDEALELAFERLAGDLSRLSEEAQILQKNISTTITDTALTLDCSVLCIENIAEQVEFDVLEKP
jgi:hypothetical protein